MFIHPYPVSYKTFCPKYSLIKACFFLLQFLQHFCIYANIYKIWIPQIKGLFITIYCISFLIVIFFSFYLSENAFTIYYNMMQSFVLLQQQSLLNKISKCHLSSTSPWRHVFLSEFRAFLLHLHFVCDHLVIVVSHPKRV